MPYSIFLSPDILVVRFSAIGDILLTTPLLRAIRAKWPGARITVLTKRQYVSLVSDNPNVTEVFGIAPQDRIRDLVKLIRRVDYTHILDLQGGLRTAPLRLLAGGPWSGYSNRRFARAMLIRFKHNRYEEHVPVAERYFEAAADLGVIPDGEPPEFFLNSTAEEKAAAWLTRAGVGTRRPFVAVAPGAAHSSVYAVTICRFVLPLIARATPDSKRKRTALSCGFAGSYTYDSIVSLLLGRTLT